VSHSSGHDATDRPTAARLEAAVVAHNSYKALTTDADFKAGAGKGVAVAGDAIRLGTSTAARSYAGTTYDTAMWTSKWVQAGQDFTELIPSWNITTPAGTWVEVWVRGYTTTGKTSTMKTMALWSSRDNGFQRTSSGSQRDAYAHVDTDTFVANSEVKFKAWQIRVQLMRKHGTTATPIVRTLGAVASQLPATVPATSKKLLGAKLLPVPKYSQMIHRGQYARYGGGGEAWCSPTSLAMILGYYKKLPAKATYTWVSKSYADPWVDHIARLTYDYGYDGTGNWPFNAAIGNTYLPDAFVTRLSSLREAERFIAAGIPLEASISFGRGGLDGAPISATDGHLVVIVGFDAAGNPIVNDPAAPNDATVQRTYKRAQFEKAWLGKSGGMVYVIHDAAHPLPPRNTNTNW
jgi:hypothetical protein